MTAVLMMEGILTFGHVKHQVLFYPKCCFLH